jgi:hypothetical protein
MNAFKKVVRPMRTHIDTSHETQMRYWARHFGVCGDDLQKAIDKVGNSASAVRKQLAAEQTGRLSTGP